MKVDLSYRRRRARERETNEEEMGTHLMDLGQVDQGRGRRC